MKEFFEAFGIVPELNCRNCLKYNDGESLYGDKGGCYDGSKKTKKCYSLYPPITSDIVLGLIGILTKKHCSITLYWGLPKLTEQILKQCIRDAKDKEIQEQVRALFNAK